MLHKQGNFKAMKVVFSLVLIIMLLISDQMRVSAAPGGLDNSFDGNGRLATDFSDGADVATDVVVQPDGKVVVVGVSGNPNPIGSAVVARYNVDGTLDNTFSGDGKLVLPSGYCTSAAVALSGTAIVIAYYATVPLSPPGALFVTRLHSNGTFDTSFDGDGTTTDTVPLNFILGDVAVRFSTIIVAGGTAGSISGGSTPPSDWLLWQFTNNGSLDTGFSGDGRVQTDFGGNLSEYATSIAVLPNGSIVVGGTGNPADQGFALARYTTNGSLDTNWGGGDGKIFTDISSGSDVPVDMEIDAGGRILLAGSSRPGGVQTGTIVRYNADGLVDGSFDGDGILQTASFGPNVENIAIQALDGKIIGIGGLTDFIVGRLNVNGTPDTQFGNAGFVVTDMNNNSDDEPKALDLSFDRRIVVAGSTLNTVAGSTRNFCVARYLPTNVLYHAPFDFDGDNKSDYGIYRPNAQSQWWINRSSNPQANVVFDFGSPSDRIVPGDFTGDGKADVALWRPSNGNWYILRSENSSFYAFPFGTTGDIPVPNDYDGDGKADAAVFRPSNATWYLSQSGGSPTQIFQFGIGGDQPVVADYDEDGKADVGIFRPGPREWWIQRSTAGLLALQFGNTGDKPVPGDYTGDGKADVAIFRPATGDWLILRSEDFSFYGFPFGAANDVPAPADYDGDGRFDPTVVRGATWFMGRTNGSTQIFGFGAVGDRPIPNAFVP
ncbi:MAG TPA: FG-GAP-like repeat-containing protein [Pyrinomonadaceae bacterium]|nr:FG-GAP-like repeat-containing protein [Pyrinomonadaceae bacterium]